MLGCPGCLLMAPICHQILSCQSAKPKKGERGHQFSFIALGTTCACVYVSGTDLAHSIQPLGSKSSILLVLVSLSTHSVSLFETKPWWNGNLVVAVSTVLCLAFFFLSISQDPTWICSSASLLLCEQSLLQNQSDCKFMTAPVNRAKWQCDRAALDYASHRNILGMPTSEDTALTFLWSQGWW